MEKKIVLLFAAALAIALLFAQGCSVSDKLGLMGNSHPKTQPLWSEVKLVQNPRRPELISAAGDIALEKFGEFRGFAAIPEEKHTLLALAWQDEIASLYSLDLRSVEVTGLGAVALKGPAPALEAVAWPWVLLGAEDEEGNHSWVLLDLSGGQAEIAWQASAWVPLGLRRQPVWFNGESWYLGPVAGPYFTDILSGETFNEFQEGLNPVNNAWPRWAGGVAGSHWYLLPVEEGSVLQNLSNGAQVSLSYNQEMVWNSDHTLLAWRQEDSLGLADTAGKTRTIVSGGVLPQSPMWSAASEKLYFLGGAKDYFGTCCNELWAWTEETGPVQLFSLPGNWAQGGLLAATDDAVLGCPGDNGEHLVYFDVAADKMYELKPKEFKWQEGTLIALLEDKLVRFSPASGSRVILKDAQDLKILALVNQYLIYSQGDAVYIKQLIM